MIKEPMLTFYLTRRLPGPSTLLRDRHTKRPNNGNKSQVHWDMVSIQRPEWGGGEIYFDNELIRKDGMFVPDDLVAFNPENLLSVG